jgi:SAM-dependent methyltransferase
MINTLTKNYNTLLLNLYSISFISRIFTYIKFYLYNMLVSKYTSILYKKFLKKIPENSIVLDIGIGNAYALIQNSDILVNKNIEIIGLDIDVTSINIAKKIIKEKNLDDFITVECVNIYDYKKEDKFDYIYFSNSYSVIPGIHEMMEYVCDNLLSDNGAIIVSTTLDNRTNYFKEVIKPKMKKILFDIDFGEHIVLENFINNMTKNNLIIENIENVYQAWIPVWGNVDIFTCFLKRNKLKQ